MLQPGFCRIRYCLYPGQGHAPLGGIEHRTKSPSAAKRQKLFLIFETAFRRFIRPWNPRSVRRVSVRNSKEEQG
jgi:hypothetical protein